MRLSTKQKIIKFLTPILLPIVKLYWKTFKPETFGVKVIIENDGKFLYVRNDYGHRSITFPGGSIEKGENAEQAAIREVKEEVGIILTNIKIVGSFTSTEEGKKDNITIFYGQSNTGNFILDHFEIAEAAWFTKDNLPKFSNLSKKIWDIFVECNF
ncbi:MAG: NUDIX domain-containing protein [Patescibacteria group bacterium]